MTLGNQLIDVQLRLLSRRQENLELKNAVTTMKVNIECNLQMVNGNIQRLGMPPGWNVVRNAGATGRQQEPLLLS